MLKIKNFVLAGILLLPFFLKAQISGLAGWDIFVDPGHSRNENMPNFDWAISEAKRNLRVALELREMLLSETDIDTVYLSRENDQVSVSLYDRTHKANSLGASWYHSIHSDAGGASQNSTLLLWGQKSDGSEKVPNGGHAMSDIMINYLTDGMRTYTEKGSIGDCSFYGCSSSGPYLYVNRNTTMPSELSEAGFHTNPRQNQLFMNKEWRRLEARTFFWSILDYHHIVRPKVNILCGLVLDKDSDNPINGAQISVEGRTYTTDTYASLFSQYTDDPDLLSNGFYYLEGINEDSVKVVVHAGHYYTDSVYVKMDSEFFTFNDFHLVSKIPPFVTASNVQEGDTSFSVLDDIELTFSRPMDTAAFDSAFSIVPGVGGTLKWFDNDTRVQFKTDSLQFNTYYTLTVSAQAKDRFGHFVDGNGDGVGGDDFQVSFRTVYDIYSPQISAHYPQSNKEHVERQPIIRVLYDELVDSASLSGDIFKLERFSDKSTTAGILKQYDFSDKSVLNFFPAEKLTADEIYVIRTTPGIKDRYGNESAEYNSFSFVLSDKDWDITSITALESDIETDWWQPGQSGSTAGTKSLPGVSRSRDTLITNLLSSGTASMKIFYDWDLNSDSWLLREYLSGGSARNVVFDTSFTLQCYVFGDGSGTLFRFALDEGDSSSWLNHEVSKWIKIDWYGWKLVQWKLSDKSQTTNWSGLGNGILDNKRYRIDSFQLSYEPGAAESGNLYFDDLRLVKEVPLTFIEDRKPAENPKQFTLEQNYPNPFNPRTTIRYALPLRSRVRITVYNLSGQRIQTLLDEVKQAGNYSVEFDGSRLSSGVYVYRMQAGDFRKTAKMFLIK